MIFADLFHSKAPSIRENWRTAAMAIPPRGKATGLPGFAVPGQSWVRWYGRWKPATVTRVVIWIVYDLGVTKLNSVYVYSYYSCVSISISIIYSRYSYNHKILY